jgi:hypothetical protein
MPRQRNKEHEGRRLSVRLTRKFAEFIDGVNLTDVKVGDRLDLSQHDAEVLIAEGWAEPQSLAADKPRRRTKTARR